jgi:predicted HAD superfamily Cof-like phosphohydrolase
MDMDVLTPGQRAPPSPQTPPTPSPGPTPRTGFHYERVREIVYESSRETKQTGEYIDECTVVIKLANEVRKAHLNDVLRALLDHGIDPTMVDTCGKFGEKGSEFQLVFTDPKYCKSFLEAKKYIAIMGPDGRGHRCPVTSIAQRAVPIRIHWLRARTAHAEVVHALSPWGEITSISDEWGGQIFKVKTGVISAEIIPHATYIPQKVTVFSGDIEQQAFITKVGGAPTCFKCRGPHYKVECPQIKKEEALAAQAKADAQAKPDAKAMPAPTAPRSYSNVAAAATPQPQAAKPKAVETHKPNMVSLRPNSAPPPPPQSPKQKGGKKQTAPSPAKGAEPMEAADGSLKRKSSSEDGEWQRAKTRGRSLSKDRNGTPTRNRHSSSGSQP